MFAYEGLGSIYWHMVSKLMLSVQEIALEEDKEEEFKALVASYYDVQDGLGFRKKSSNMELSQQMLTLIHHLLLEPNNQD